MLRKIITFSMVFILMSAISSCTAQKEKETTAAPETTEAQTTQLPSVQETQSYQDVTVYEESTEAVTSAETTAASEVLTTEAATQAVITTEAQITEAQTNGAVQDASDWDTLTVIEFYKNAADKTGGSVKSEQTVGLNDISVNNGQLGGVFSFVTPILSSFLSSSKTVTDGITGDFRSLTAEDVSTARAYESANGTVVEITLKEQTEKGESDKSDGSVAHGISVVGDLMSVMGQLKEKGLPIDISMEKTVISYTGPVIKALVGNDGKIVNGTWSCNVEINLSDYKFAGSAVDSTRVVIDNKITVNGGFSA